MHLLLSAARENDPYYENLKSLKVSIGYLLKTDSINP